MESARYENMWRSMKGEFHVLKDNYKSKYPEPALLEFIKFLKQNKVNGKVLDLGCGNGRNCVAFAKQGFDVCGIDVSESAIDLAKKNAKESNVFVNLKRGSVFNLPYKEKQFEVIIDFGLLHHLRKSQWQKYRKNILRVLKQNGYYCLNCFSSATKTKLKPKNRNWRIIGKHYDHFFTISELRSFFSRDFKILRIIKSQNKRTKIRFLTIYLVGNVDK